MRLVLLSGDDDLAVQAHRAQLLSDSGAAPGSVERFDVAEDGGAALTRAASSMSLFGGARVLDASNAQELTEQFAAALADAHSDAVVLLRPTGSMPAATKKALGAHLETISCRLPSGRGVAMRVEQLAVAAGITLDETCLGLLAERAGTDLPRVASVLTQLATVGLTRPTREQVLTLLGSAAAPGVPWALSDALEAGDLPTALGLAATLEPVAVVSYLANRTGQVGRILDEGLSDADEVASAFGMASRYPAQRLARLAARVGRGGVASCWDLISAADRAVKVGDNPGAALDVLLVRLAALWGTADAAPVVRAGRDPFASPLTLTLT